MSAQDGCAGWWGSRRRRAAFSSLPESGDEGSGGGAMVGVLAIGVDALEPSLVDGMLAAGELPALRSILDGGARSVVVSPAVIGSGAVWPSFATGEPATEHGIYSQWVWDAEAMGLAPASLEGVRPFWARLAAEGRRIAVLDVPFTRPERPRDGVEIVEWGAHDWCWGGHRSTRRRCGGRWRRWADIRSRRDPSGGGSRRTRGRWRGSRRGRLRGCGGGGSWRCG